MEITLTSNNFDSEVLKSSKPVLVDFWASWCGPCKMLAPIIEEISNEYGDIIKVGKVNVDDQRELAQKYDILSIPTVLLFKDGKITNKSIGFVPKEKIIEMFN
jgi:thioredoxin 1